MICFVLVRLYIVTDMVQYVCKLLIYIIVCLDMLERHDASTT